MAVTNATSLSDVIRDGRWLAHRYDETSDSIHFRFLPREEHQRATFLTDHELGQARLTVHPRASCLAEARQLGLAAPRFIFHSAYCCSTLLARAFDVAGVSFGLKEPQILNDIAGLQLRRADPRQIAAALDAALLLLARPLSPGEVNVIKPSNVFNPSIGVTLALRPDTRAVLLYAPLDSFVASIARKELEGRAWVRELMWKFLQLGMADRFGFTAEELYRHTDLQVGALGWLAQHALFSEIASLHPERVRTLNSDVLTGNPRGTIAALAEHFAVPLDAAAVASGPVFTRHSKTGESFAASDRARERDSRIELHRREVEMVVEWSRKVAEHAGIALTTPSPLGDERLHAES
jgi:hypothetical protein